MKLAQNKSILKNTVEGDVQIRIPVLTAPDPKMYNAIFSSVCFTCSDAEPAIFSLRSSRTVNGGKEWNFAIVFIKNGNEVSSKEAFGEDISNSDAASFLSKLFVETLVHLDADGTFLYSITDAPVSKAKSTPSHKGCLNSYDESLKRPLND